MALVDNELWREFFQEFRNCPELWKVKSSVYKNKQLRNKAFIKLMEIYKKIESGATIVMLKNKLNNIKTCYRRELKKIIESEKSGAGADDIYVPSLWYYDLLDFLTDHEIPVPGVSSLDSDDQIEEIENQNENDQQRPKRVRIGAKKINNNKAELLQKAINHLDEINSKTKEDGDIFAESWALSFNKLSTDQKLYAKKAIDEILILGQLKQLSLNVVPPISPVSTNGNTPVVLSRTSTPNTATPPTILDYYSPETAVYSPETPVFYQSVGDLFCDSQFS